MALSVGNVSLHGPQSGGGVRAGAESFGAREAAANSQLAQSAGRAGTQVHAAVQQAQHERKETDFLEKQMAYEDGQRAFDTNYKQTKRGKDALTAAADYAAENERLLSEIGKSFKNEKDALEFKKRVYPQARNFVSNGARWEIEQDDAHKTDTVNAYYGRMIEEAKKPGASPEAVNSMWSAYEAEANKIMPWRGEAQRQKERQGFMAARQEGVRQGVVSEAISNPSAVLASTQPAMFGSIQDGSAKWGEIAEIPQEFQQLFTPTEYVSLMSYAHVVASKQLATQLKMDGEALKLARENAEKELYEKGFSGTITRADVEAHRDILSPVDYNRFLGMTSGANLLPEKSEPGAIITLTTAATNGDSDLQAQADEMLRAGRITIGDYRAAINEGQQFRDPIEKQVMEEIKLLTGYSDMNPNPAAAENYVSAKRDYLAWRDSEAGKKATPQERREMGSQLARNYRLVSEENILTAKIPFYLVGSRTAPDIESTIIETDKAYQGGKLTDEQYGEQMARIKKLNDLIEQQRIAEETAESRRGRR